MWKQIVIAGTAGAALVGGGAIALAADSPSSTSSSPAAASASATASTHSSAAAKKPARRERVKQALTRLKNFDQGEWVTGPSGATVTHQAIKGKVSAVSPTSIQVKAADGTSLTFVANSSTKVALREGGKGSAKKGTIADVKPGDTVLVTGTKTGTTSTATAIADTGTK
jgi:preprotein translocase subunit YajC